MTRIALPLTLLLAAVFFNLTSYAEVSPTQGVSPGAVNNEPGCDNVSGALKGVFGVGTIGPSCPALSMGLPHRLQFLYSDFVVSSNNVQLDEAAQNTQIKLTEPSAEYIKSYGVLVTNLIDQIAYDYLREQELLESDERDGQPASNEEIKAWQLLAKVVAYQESLFSHYQMLNSGDADGEKIKGLTDEQRMRVLVGDPQFERVCKGVGIISSCRVKLDKNGRPVAKRDPQGRRIYASIGMYQLHAAQTGRPLKLRKDDLDLVKNIESGISYLYPRWSQIIGVRKMRSPLLRSAFARCQGKIVKNKKINYSAAIRAVYGMYNGGDSQICRFVVSDQKNEKYEKENRNCAVGMISFRNQAHKKLCESRQMCGSVACPWVNDVRIKKIVESRPWEVKLSLSDTLREAKYRNKDNRFNFKFNLTCARDGHEVCSWD